MSNLADRKKKDAVQQFINRDFQAVPQELISSYFGSDDYAPILENITEITKNDRVYCDDGKEGEVVAIKGMDDEKTIDVRIYEDGKDKIVNFPADEVYLVGPEGTNGYPMWNTMWLLDRDYWIEHVQELSESGFTVYDAEDLDKLVVGIDGAGYSFMDEHFAPLYDRMGYTWHLQKDPEMYNLERAAVRMGVEAGLKPEDISQKLNLPLDTVKEHLPEQQTK